MEIDCDATGFGDVKAVDVVFISGAISAGEDEEAILVQIDESLSGAGTIAAFEVLSTDEGSAIVHGLEVGATINPVLQLSGTFGDMDEVDNEGNNHLSQFTSTSTDVTMFAANTDIVIIGDAAKFEEIEFILDTVASNPGIKPTFRYSTGSGTWQAFTPTDGTNGMRNNGVIAWTAADVASPAWAVGTSGNFLIEITRSASAGITAPIEDIVQIAAVTEFSWNASGNLSINALTVAGTLGVTGLITATAGVTSGSNIISDTDSTDDLGSTSVRWANLWVDSVAITTTFLVDAVGPHAIGGAVNADIYLFLQGAGPAGMSRGMVASLALSPAVG